MCTSFSFILLATWASPVSANLDVIGVTALRHFEPNLTGTGIPVAQVEASAPGWQANPAAVGPVDCQMTWTCASGCATNFPNPLGTESGHANEVGRLFFGGACGVAPGVTQMDNFEAQYFTSAVVPNEIPIAAKIVNQSFTYFARNTRVDQQYDNYASRYNVLFVSGAGNSGWVRSPGTAYNSISVAAYGGLSSIGPSTDGRSKPDITAPASATSFSTPLVAGAAALLMQAGATDIRLLKALLLNGAQKPADWTNAATAPVDQRYGAGVLNIFNSWRQLRGGQHAAGASVTARRGWDLRAVSSTNVQRYSFSTDRVSPFTATLVWLRQYGCTNITDLNLLLLQNGARTVPVRSSESSLDNVEHLYIPNLSPGPYVLEISATSGSDTYALAFDLGPSIPPRLSPWTLTGEPNQRYVIESTTDLRIWAPWLTNITSAAGILHFSPTTDSPMRIFRTFELP